jgi:hypothetical protein
MAPSWETTSHSAAQEFPRILWNPRFHHRVYKSSSLFPIRCLIIIVHPLDSSSYDPPTSVLPSAIVHSGFPTKTLHAFPFSPFELLVLPISFSLPCSFGLYLVKSNCYEVSFSLPSLNSSTLQLFSSAPCCHVVHFLELLSIPWCQKPSFTPIQNLKQSYHCIYLNCYGFYAGDEKTNFLDRMVADMTSIKYDFNFFTNGNLFWKPYKTLKVNSICLVTLK